MKSTSRAVQRGNNGLLPNLESRGYYANTEPLAMPGVLHHQMPRLESCGTPVDGYFFMHVANTTTSSEAPQRIFENYVHADGNSILCISNFSRRDTYFHSGHRLFWSDAMAECCVRAMRHSRGTMEGLETIWRLTISNEVRGGMKQPYLSVVNRLTGHTRSHKVS